MPSMARLFGLRFTPARTARATQSLFRAVGPVQAIRGLPVRRRKRPLDVYEFSASPMCGRSPAPAHVKCAGDNPGSPSHPDQYLPSMALFLRLDSPEFGTRCFSIGHAGRFRPTFRPRNLPAW